MKPPETSPLPPDTSVQVSGHGCPSVHPASFLYTAMPVLQPPSELPRTLSKNALSAQLSQHWLSRLQGMPEKKRASLDLKPRCPNPDPWVQAIKLKTGEWTSVRFQGMSSQLGPGPDRGAVLAAGSCPALSPHPSSPLPAQDEPLRAQGTSLGLSALQPQAVLTEGLRATVRGCV